MAKQKRMTCLEANKKKRNVGPTYCDLMEWLFFCFKDAPSLIVESSKQLLMIIIFY